MDFFLISSIFGKLETMVFLSGKRSFARYFLAIFNKKHWLTVFKSMLVIKSPFIYLFRYISGGGDYPYSLFIRTPVGVCAVKILRFEDMFTLNEIFIWEVYKANSSCRFVDIGGNVGFASLYFLTRSINSCGVLIEPLSSNFSRASELLERFGDRIILLNYAVAADDGSIVLGVEETGRYSGIDCVNGTLSNFEALGINTLLENALSRLKTIDIVKVDCEGAEREFMPKINQRNLSKIQRFVIEGAPIYDKNLINHGFVKSVTYDDGQSGGVFEYVRNSSI